MTTLAPRIEWTASVEAVEPMPARPIIRIDDLRCEVVQVVGRWLENERGNHHGLIVNVYVLDEERIETHVMLDSRQSAEVEAGR